MLVLGGTSVLRGSKHLVALLPALLLTLDKALSSSGTVSWLVN